MKKISIISLLFSTALASATTLSSSQELTGNVVLNDVLDITGSGTLTMGDYTYSLRNVTTDFNLVSISDGVDYTLDGKTYLTGNLEKSGWFKFSIGEGATLRITDLDLSKMTNSYINDKGNKAHYRTGTGWYGKETTDQTKYGVVYLGSTDADAFSNGSIDNDELWLNYVNLHATSGISYGYIHFQFGCVFTVETDNVRIGTIAVRQPNSSSTTYNKDDAFSGKIDLNGYSMYTDGITFNPSATKATLEECPYVDFYIDFGENTKSQYIYLRTLTESGYNATTKVFHNDFSKNKLFIENLEKDDFVVFGDDITTLISDGLTKSTLLNVLSQILYVNGKAINSEDAVKDLLVKLTAEDLEKYGFTDTTLIGKWAVIPEPSTYAMILGAIALGFVAYRRRK